MPPDVAKCSLGGTDKLTPRLRIIGVPYILFSFFVVVFKRVPEGDHFKRENGIYQGKIQVGAVYLLDIVEAR